MLNYPAGWTCERTVLKFGYYLLSTLPLNEALAVVPRPARSGRPARSSISGSCSPMCRPASSRRPSYW